MRALGGKAVMVIGGACRIGAAVSRRLADDGASLGIIYPSRTDDAQRLECSLLSLGHRVSMAQADIGDVGALNAAIGAIAGHYGQLDILVSVAGIAITGPLADYAEDGFDRTFAVNVRAPFLAAHGQRR